MRRRNVLLALTGVGVAAAAGAVALRPRPRGAPHEPYFAALQAELKANGPMRPCLVIDLDRLDHNIDCVTRSVAKVPGRHYRIVEKSLPSAGLIGYVAKRAGTSRLMSFHQPFLSHDAVAFPEADLLLGKPLPVRAAEAFYRGLAGPFDPARQVQWLIDTPARLAQYLELARGLRTRMRISVEIDVGLHRGGVPDDATLSEVLKLIEANPEQLELGGLMGYDPHVTAVPGAIASRDELFARSMGAYQARVDHLRRAHPSLWRDDLVLNGAGSPTYKLHEAETLTNEVSVGSALVKPTHFDTDTLAEHQVASYIATPVIKSVGPVQIPGLDARSRIFSWWDPNQRGTYFIYGGNWMAEYVSPPGLQFNSVYGHSSNQEIVNADPAVGLAPDDIVFLRPTQSEGVLLQFGDLLGVRGGKLVEQWPVFQG